MTSVGGPEKRCDEANYQEITDHGVDDCEPRLHGENLKNKLAYAVPKKERGNTESPECNTYNVNGTSVARSDLQPVE